MLTQLSATSLLKHFEKKSLERGEMLARDDGLRQKKFTKKFHNVLPISSRNLAKPLRKMIKKSIDRARVMSEDYGLNRAKD